MTDYEIDHDQECSCGHLGLHYRACTNFHCDDGYVDQSDDDAINYMPGESYMKCDECNGTGVEVWCPACGKNLSGTISEDRTCRVCGCTDSDCRGCIDKTGLPCHWVEADLCSACVEGKL